MKPRLRISRKEIWIEVGEPPQEEPHNRLRFSTLLVLAVLFLVISSLLVVLFVDGGMIARFAGVDLSFLLVPLLISNGLVLVGNTVRRVLPGELGRITGVLMKGTGYAVAGYVLFHEAATILSALETETALPSERLFTYVDRLGLFDTFAILFVVGVILARLSIAGFVLMGIAVREGFSIYTSFYSPLAKVGTILLVSFIFVGVGIALRPFGEAPNSILAGVGQWTGRSQLRNFTFGGFLATYFLVIRPALFNTFVYALLFEWILVVAVAWRIFAGLRGSIGQAYLLKPQPLPREVWQRHEQRISQTHPEFFPYLQEIQREFLEEGIKDGFLIHVVTLLGETDLRHGQLADIVHPLLHYRDSPVPVPALPREALDQEQK